jgi:aarF domain-containing kinase
MIKLLKGVWRVQVVLRRLFEKLGPTYIKLGQFIASSPTLFPEEYVLEFQKCLDRTAAVPWEVIKATIDSDLGAPADQVFSYINHVPLATASIAQVHRAG